MENTIIELFKTLLSDFGITGALYIFIIGSFIYYTPKMINKHFDAINKMQDKFSDNLKLITTTFENKIEESNSWHIKHNEKLEKTNYRLKRIEDNLKLKD